MPTVRLKPHLRAHVISPGEVALLGENGRVALHGEVYSALIPLLDGRLHPDEMVEALRRDFRPEIVYHALTRLEAKGFLDPNPDSAGDASERAWWSLHGSDDASRRTPVVCWPVRVVDAGAHPPARDALLQALNSSRSIEPRRGARELDLIVAGDYIDERASAAVAAACREGRWALPVRLEGAAAWLGPLVDAERAGRFALLLVRLAANRPADVAALRAGATFPLLPPQGLPETYALAAAWVVAALIAIASGSPPAGLLEGLITLDPWTGETRRHPVAPGGALVVRPACDPDVEIPPLELTSRPKRYTADGGHRVCPPDETLTRLESMLGPIAGIVHDVARLEGFASMPVYAALIVNGAERVGYRANRILGRPTGAIGKGATALQARASCLAEAVERYSCGFFGDEPRVRARIDRMGERACDPAQLLGYSDAQYRDRDALNAVWGVGYNWIPARFDREREIDWTPAWSLTKRHTVWLPTSFCYYGYQNPQDHYFCLADSNGCAAGNALEEAILQGFLELVERDACALWWYNRVRRPGIDIGSFHDPVFDAFRAEVESNGRELAVLDLTNDLGIPTAVAVSWRRGGGDRVCFGLGCHLQPRVAVSRALAEMSQMVTKDRELLAGIPPETAVEADYARWLDEVDVHTQQYFLPACGPLRSAASLEDLSTPDLRDDVEWCVERLRRLGLEMIVLDQTRPDTGFPVARVTVPGLRHFWARFGPGRLYDVPAVLGWVERPLVESELNPIPCFI